MRAHTESYVCSCAAASALGKGSSLAALALQSACTCRRKRIAPTHKSLRRRHGILTKASEAQRLEDAPPPRTQVSC